MVWKRGGTKSKREYLNSPKVKVVRRKGRKPKLSEEDKEKVVDLYLKGDCSIKELSEFFNVSEMTIYRVVNTYIEENFSGKDFDEVFEKVKERVWGNP